ncbi:MAG: diguanylate cyclase [Chromatiaceae bacterium]|nr:diguanylate cyclase [Chromatiaceae bacterium]
MRTTYGEKVLLVDDSKAITRLLRDRCEVVAGVETETAGSLAEVMASIESDPDRFFLAVVDLNLPDAPDGEVVDYVLAHEIPVVVLTGHYDDATRERMLAKNVVDYLVKASVHEIEHAAHLVRRIRRNREVQVLVVDDSRAYRQYIGELLSLQHLRVLYAENGREALAVMDREPGISLVVTDYNMPELDGLGLITALRQRRGRDDLAIIGVSDTNQPSLPARLLKTGANDFITKPFLVEEFYCRVTQNLDLVEQIRAIRESAVRDYLTGLYNRRHLFEAGEALYSQARRGHTSLAAVMLDIDHFKRVNDTYGHLAGDRVLKEIAGVLAKGLRRADLIGRYGGEEFCILLPGIERDALLAKLESLRDRVARTPIAHGAEQLSVTISMGANLEPAETLQALIDRADAALYQAKEGGRNRAVMADDLPAVASGGLNSATSAGPPTGAAPAPPPPV